MTRAVTESRMNGAIGPEAIRPPDATITPDLATVTIAIPDPTNVRVSAEQVAAVASPLLTELQVALAVARAHIAELRATCELFQQQVEALRETVEAS